MDDISLPVGESTLDIDGRKLAHSAFNVVWLAEFGIYDPKVIFDIGAYDAGDSIRFKIAFPESSVFSFEADPHRCTKIREFVGEYGVNFYEFAIGSDTGSVVFYPSLCMGKDAGDTHYPGFYGGQGSRYKHNSRYRCLYDHIIQQESIKVRSISVSDFCLANGVDKIDLAHIDVEGSELDVIQGFGNFSPSVVYIETINGLFEDAPTVLDVHEALISKSYSLVKDFGSDRLYRFKTL